MKTGDPISRRRFLKNGARAGVLIGLTWISLRLLGKRGKADESCVNGWICRGCGRLRKCSLPQALSLQEALKRGNR